MNHMTFGIVLFKENQWICYFARHLINIDLVFDFTNAIEPTVYTKLHNNMTN
jgi:hypothetical protein